MSDTTRATRDKMKTYLEKECLNEVASMVHTSSIMTLEKVDFSRLRCCMCGIDTLPMTTEAVKAERQVPLMAQNLPYLLTDKGCFCRNQRIEEM